MATKAKTPNDASAQAKPEGAQALRVVPKRDGFRRAGYSFAGERTIALDELSDAQYTQLTTEPMLVTMLVDLPAAAAAA